VKEGRARVGGGAVEFAGTLTDDGVYDGRARVDGLDLAALLPATGSSPKWSGRVSGALTLQGPLARPRVAGEITSPRVFLADEGVGALEGRVRGRGDGTVAVDARCRSARVDLALAGTVGAAAPYVADLTVTAQQTSLDPFARA